MDSGVSAMASMKNSRPVTSDSDRRIIAGRSMSRLSGVSSDRTAQTAKTITPSRPKLISTCEIGNEVAACFSSVSSTAKAAIASTMNAAPCRFHAAPWRVVWVVIGVSLRIMGGMAP